MSFFNFSNHYTRSQLNKYLRFFFKFLFIFRNLNSIPGRSEGRYSREHDKSFLSWENVFYEMRQIFDFHSQFFIIIFIQNLFLRFSVLVDFSFLIIILIYHKSVYLLFCAVFFTLGNSFLYTNFEQSVLSQLYESFFPIHC